MNRFRTIYLKRFISCSTLMRCPTKCDTASDSATSQRVPASRSEALLRPSAGRSWSPTRSAPAYSRRPRRSGTRGPNPAARRLRTGRAGALGLIFSERLRYQFTDPAAPAFLGGVARGMEDAPMGLLLIPDSRFRDATAETVRGAAVDGFIIYSAVRKRPPSRGGARPRATHCHGGPAARCPDPVPRHRRPRGREHGRPTPAGARTPPGGVLSFVSAIDREGKLVLELVLDRLAGYREGLGDAWDEDTVRTCRPNATKPAREASLDLLRGPNRPPPSSR